MLLLFDLWLWLLTYVLVLYYWLGHLRYLLVLVYVWLLRLLQMVRLLLLGSIVTWINYWGLNLRWVSVLRGYLLLGQGQCFDHNLVILVAVLVPNLFLVVSATPVAIDDVFVLVFAWLKRIGKLKLIPVYTFHRIPLLPIGE